MSKIVISGCSYEKFELDNKNYIVFTNANISINRLKKLISSNLSEDWLYTKLTEELGEFSLVSYSENDGSVEKINLYRSITSFFELFYFIKNDVLFVSNSFKNLVACLDVKDKEHSLEAIVDLFLFQRNFGEQTYVKPIKRIRPGSELSYNALNKTLRIEQLHKLSLPTLFSEASESLIGIEKAIEEHFNKTKATDKINTLSGGIDSSLVQSFINKKNSISIAFDTNDFSNEIEYASEASKLLKTNHEFINVPEANYLSELKNSISILGQPAPDLPNLVIANSLSKIPVHQSFVTSLLADALFGLPIVNNLNDSNRELEECDHTVHSIDGLASSRFFIARKSDLEILKNVFGENLIANRLDARLKYIERIVDYSNQPSTGLISHIQFGSIIDYYSNNILASFRGIGNYYNKTFSSPFVDFNVVKSSFQCNLSNRYYSQEFGAKHLLKKLLLKRVNNFPVNKNKLGGALPRTKFYTFGPLKNYYLENDIPDFIPNEFSQELKNPNWDNSWIVLYSIFYSIWKEIILDEDIKTDKNTLVIE